MALSDLQQFIQERLASLDETTDLSPGSPADTQVVQPIMRRLGTDPFSVDMGVFIQDRLNQEFPELPSKEGDAITDLLIKPAIVMMDPLVRENFRIRAQLSFKDPTVLTLDEAEALGANLFAERNKGDTARGVARLYFARPQNISIGPANFITSKGGLHFFPTETQSITATEMIFNLESDLYYFDVNCAAESPGEEYNINPDELVTIANIGPALRITNKSRFRFGVPAETAADFVDRVEQDLTERSLVTERGITAKIAKSFTEVTRLAITGYRDPEMNRDIITGGGLGKIILGGVALTTIADGEAAATTRRASFNSISEGTTIDFTATIGPPGPVEGFTLTVFDAFLTAVYPRVRDIKVRAVVDATTLDLEDQVLKFNVTGKAWTLRKSELTLSGIPGGILFPDAVDGSVAIPNDEVHIGGTTDVYLRGTDVDVDTLLLNDIVDDSPILSGLALTVTDAVGNVTLGDLVLNGNYAVDDATYQALSDSVGLSLQVLDPPIAATYRILSITHVPGFSPILNVTPAPAYPIALSFRWRLLDILDINLVEPKETRISGSDLTTIQGSDLVDTAGGVDFDAYGVSAGDILRITSGTLVQGDYTVLQVISPLFTKVQVDRPLPATTSNIAYSIFRLNIGGGIALPLLRVNTVDLLDTSNQPVGTTVPYAKPIDIQARSFANAGHGVKEETKDMTLGCVGDPIQDGFADVNGLTLLIHWTTPSGLVTVTITFAGATTTIASVISQINAQTLIATAGAVTRLAVVLVDDAPFNRVGIIPVGTNTEVYGGTALATLFGAEPLYNSREVRSATVGDWSLVRPTIDKNFDVVQVQDGLQIGFYGSLVLNTSGFAIGTAQDFQPEIKRNVAVGSRSFGSARLFFLEPTSIEFNADSRLQVESGNGTLTYLPDPTLDYQRIPALPSETKPKDAALSGTGLTSVSLDFIKRGIVAGDELIVDYQPLLGSVVLADPVLTLEFKILTLSVSGGVDKNVIFVKDDTAIPAGSVTRAGVADQINKVIGQNICTITAGNKLEFEADLSITVRGTGSANTLLGFPGTDVNNNSASKGTYAITAVPSPTQLTVTPAFVGVTTRQQYKVFRKGVQRIVSTQMSKQVAETGLYYFDLELISVGTGDQYNIPSGLRMTSMGYRSDGYYLTTDDLNLTFSPAEKVRMHVSPTILEVGVTDNPDNATALSGQNLQVNYERSAITASVQNFLTAETERVICQSPLARHLIPHFIRFDLVYSGGSQESEVRPDIEKLIKGLFPADSLEVSDLERILTMRGAKSITNPVTLLAVVHNFDRSIVMERSQDRLNTGRLAAFIPDVLNIARKLA